jgi:HKD family nuclease
VTKVKFLMQGIEEKNNHRNSLVELLSLQDVEEIILSSAFLTSDGVYLLKDELVKNKEKISIYVGCRNGITSKQGIISLLELGITPYVIDTGSRRFIFHPKAFVAISPLKALSIVGSANLTYGGLINNLESSTLVSLDLTDKNDKAYIDEFSNAFKVLREQFPENVVKVTSIEMAERLYEEGKLVDEEETSEIVSVGRSKGSKKVTPTMKLKREKVNLPLKSKRKKKNTGVTTGEQVERNESTFAILDKGLELVEVWKSKELKERDLNVPSGEKTNVTGSMLLKKGQYDIDQQVYFRNVVFNKLDWAPKQGKPNYFHYAKAQFYFVIDGVNYGKYELEIKHDTRTNTKTYKQRQPMTHLLWGDAKSLVANPNLLGKELTLYEVVSSSNEFVIDIS